MPPFVPIKKHRSPGNGEKACPPCNGMGSVNAHVCPTCHGAGVVPEPWKSGDGPLNADGKIQTAGAGSTPPKGSGPNKGRTA
jgi:hypothetical protein